MLRLPPIRQLKAELRQAIWDAVNSPGAALVQFIGHGNYTVWSDDAFFDERYVPRDTSYLVNGLELPWLIVHNCLTGGFHGDEPKSMGEQWIKRQIGGAIAMLDRLEIFHLAIFGLAAAATLVWRLRNGDRQAERHRQATWIAVGMVGGYLPFALLYMVPFVFGGELPGPLAALAVMSARSSSAVMPRASRAAAKASSVGAKTVKGPSPSRVSTRPAAWTAATRVVNSLATATSKSTSWSTPLLRATATSFARTA